MIARKLDRFIERHFQNSRAALLLTGARQTGKTFAIRKFASSSGLELLEINFLEDPRAKMIFQDHGGASDILLRLTAYAGRTLPQGRTLVFFDEIQNYPEVVTMIKFLVDDGRFRYALSGSLLGIELKNIRSVPVGYLSVKEVHPIDFQEFLLALGVSGEVIGRVKSAFETGEPVDPVVHDSLMRQVLLYLIVGGMPAVVQTYLDTYDIAAVQAKQKEILQLYKWDISQYDPERKLYINEIFDLIPSELDAKNKRFILKKLNEGSRFTKYENGFIWLKDAGVALPVFNVEEPKAPLKLAEQRNLFKLFQNDVGLLACQYVDGTALSILSGRSQVNFGAIYENMVAQELAAHGSALYFFNSKKQGELDFVLERDGDVLPVEVKSGKDYERHNALSNVLANTEYGIRQAIVLYNGPGKVAGPVKYLPMYMTMFLAGEAPEIPPQVFVPDLSGLQ